MNFIEILCIVLGVTVVVAAVVFFIVQSQKQQQVVQQQRQNQLGMIEQIMAEYGLGNEIIAYKAGKPVKARKINGKVVIIDEVPKRGRDKPSI
jgi:type II secretory pathway pseudopilin PulG